MHYLVDFSQLMSHFIHVVSQSIADRSSRSCNFHTWTANIVSTKEEITRSWCIIVYSFSLYSPAVPAVYIGDSRLRWSRGCVLASSNQFRGFKPGRSPRIFQGEKFPSMPSFGGKVKPAVPCRRFTARKRSLNVTWKSAFSKILGYSLSPIKSSPSRRLDLASRRTWRHLTATVGTSRKQGVQ
jgi:hypothetical protein